MNAHYLNSPNYPLVYRECKLEHGIWNSCLSCRQRTIQEDLKRAAPRLYDALHDLYYSVSEHKQNNGDLGDKLEAAEAAMSLVYY